MLIMMTRARLSALVLVAVSLALTQLCVGFRATVVVSTVYAVLALWVTHDELLDRLQRQQAMARRSLCHERFSASKVPERLDAVVIGSGMAGLSCAGVLSRMGKKVLVLEQHDVVGGGG